MPGTNRRKFLQLVARGAGASVAASLYPASIERALAIPANNATGTIRDVEHIVIFMQENRSFDHYFGTMAGVRGFGDRFPIPVPDAPDITGKTVWYQSNVRADGTQADPAAPKVVAPFRLDTAANYEFMRVTGAPHLWTNAQAAWADGSINQWPVHKHPHAMAYFAQADLPYQYALANAFTLCDAYHCSFQGGTNPNRCYVWSGVADPNANGWIPAIGNLYNHIRGGNPSGGYEWVTFPERLERAGVSWQVYEDMADNYSLNPLAGFKRFRDAFHGVPGSSPALRQKGLTTRDLDAFRADVLSGNLPSVSWICATEKGCEHPSSSSPAQGAEYTERVLEALTASPEVWSKTVLFLMFDENDGFFDHVPPPAVPSRAAGTDGTDGVAGRTGLSSVDTRGEYHDTASGEADDPPELMHRPYGLGPRVPMYVISPWSKGGWVNSELFDHTSVLRFVEERFGVAEANITPWRRAVCGDLTSTFNFSRPDALPFVAALPPTQARAERARALGKTKTPPTPGMPDLPVQERGVRPSRALPYDLEVDSHHMRIDGHDAVVLKLWNRGSRAAVVHVYDRMNLSRAPRRFTIGAGAALEDHWLPSAADPRYDLWMLGPNGFHRHFTGELKPFGNEVAITFPEVRVGHADDGSELTLLLANPLSVPLVFRTVWNAYGIAGSQPMLAAGSELRVRWPLAASARWYDFTVSIDGWPRYFRRFAGRVENGVDSTSDPAMGGPALGERWWI